MKEICHVILIAYNIIVCYPIKHVMQYNHIGYAISKLGRVMLKGYQARSQDEQVRKVYHYKWKQQTQTLS